MSEKRSVPFRDLVITPECQMREGIRPEVVDKYATQLDEGVAFEGYISAVECEQGIVVYDGFHRYEAYRIYFAKKGSVNPSLTVSVEVGTFDLAIDLACRANGEHGLPRTKADERKAVTCYLQRHPDYSPALIAQHCRVTRDLVRGVKESLLGDSPSNPVRTYMRNGKKCQMDTTKIGGIRVMPPQVLVPVSPEVARIVEQFGSLPAENIAFAEEMVRNGNGTGKELVATGCVQVGDENEAVDIHEPVERLYAAVVERRKQHIALAKTPPAHEFTATTKAELLVALEKHLPDGPTYVQVYENGKIVIMERK